MEVTNHLISSNLETVTISMHSMQTVSHNISTLQAKAINFTNVQYVARFMECELAKCQAVQCRGDSIRVRIFKALNSQDVFQFSIIYLQARKME